ncbi:unnamed protein product [Arabidopsis halleri]
MNTIGTPVLYIVQFSITIIYPQNGFDLPWLKYLYPSFGG